MKKPVSEIASVTIKFRKMPIILVCNVLLKMFTYYMTIFGIEKKRRNVWFSYFPVTSDEVKLDVGFNVKPREMVKKNQIIGFSRSNGLQNHNSGIHAIFNPKRGVL